MKRVLLPAGLGGYGLETDITVSSDGVLFLMHDNTLARTTDGQEPAAPDGVFDVIWFGVPVILVLGLIVWMRYRRTRSD